MSGAPSPETRAKRRERQEKLGAREALRSELDMMLPIGLNAAV